MSIFGSILDKIFHHSTASGSPAAGTAAPSAPPLSATTSSSAAVTAASPASGKLAEVDVEAVLAKLAEGKGGGGNWRTSIVDLLKLLDLDSSMAARKDLAQELGVHAGADGSAEQNMALQKAVMNKLAENGGKVPESLRK